MTTLTAIIERNEGIFFAFIENIDGCVTTGSSYEEIKTNLDDVLALLANDDSDVAKIVSGGYKIRFQIKIDSIFKFIPELNMSQIGRAAKMNPGLLRQYVSGNKNASEAQNEKVMRAIYALIEKLDSVNLVV